MKITPLHHSPRGRPEFAAEINRRLSIVCQMAHQPHPLVERYQARRAWAWIDTSGSRPAVRCGGCDELIDVPDPAGTDLGPGVHNAVQALLVDANKITGRDES